MTKLYSFEDDNKMSSREHIILDDRNLSKENPLLSFDGN